MTTNLVDALMSTRPLEELLPAARAATADDTHGAVVTFDGVVRNHDGGNAVAALTYSAHPSADEIIAAVAARVAADFPEVRLWAAHRTGALAVGDLAFVVIAASAHRGPAFRACAALADAVKAEVPIWKDQELSSGDHQWVGLE